MRVLWKCFHNRKRQRKSTRNRPDDETEPTETLPFLPTQPLTSSKTCANQDPDSLCDQGSYGTFGRLPPEIRRMILVHAFGGRTVHVDLSYRHPLVRRPLMTEQSHKKGRTHCGLGKELIEDGTLPRRWQWFSCVCHRSAETDYPHQISFYKFEQAVWPFEDQCLEGHLCHCNGVEVQSRADECFLGAIGWLLACRGAYVDGLQVLMSTNTFYLSSIPLLLNLPRLIPQANLDKITSLRLAWGVHYRTRCRPQDPLMDGLWNGAGADRNACALPMLCRTVPEIFSNVRSLEVYLQSQVIPPKEVPVGERLQVMERDVLGPVEKMTLALGIDVGVAVPREAWLAMVQRYKQIEGEDFKAESFVQEKDGYTPRSPRFWRSLGVGTDGRSLGYWVIEGWNDHEYVNFPGMISCFGTGAEIRDVWGFYRREAQEGRRFHCGTVTYVD